MNKNKYFQRHTSSKILDLQQHFPVVVISGARQVGKSTLLQHIFPDLPRVVFDPVIDVENARQDPDLFLAQRKPPIILDEIQYAPQLVTALKRRLEKDRQPGQYLLTGSQQWGIMKLLSESLAGRAVFLDLEGFSLAEIAEADAETCWLPKWLQGTLPAGGLSRGNRLNVRFPFFEQLWRGFLPEAQFLPIHLIPDFHLAYQRTYVERDVRQLADVSDTQLFSRFFRLCGAMTAQEINFRELGREIGVTPQTATRWLDVLKGTFQWFEVPAYGLNAIKRISSRPKGYLSDTGLICSSLAISSPEAISSHPLWGSLYETAVVCEIRKQCRLLPTPPNLYHWRSHGGGEVDLLLEWNGQIYPIEVKGKSHPTRTDASGLLALRKTYPHLTIGSSLIIAPAESCYPVSEQIFVLPWDAMW